MKALNLSQTLEAEGSKPLFCRTPPNTFPVGPVHIAFQEDVTYMFPHKLRAFFFSPGLFNQAGMSCLPSAPELEWTLEELFMGGMLIT